MKSIGQRLLLGVLLAGLLPWLSGCAIGLLAAGVGYGVGQGRKGDAAKQEAKAKWVQQYTTYKVELEKVNLEREKAGLKPVAVMEFDEWINTQPLNADEIKLFKVNKGATTKKELKEAQVELPTTNSLPSSTKAGNWK